MARSTTANSSFSPAETARSWEGPGTLRRMPAALAAATAAAAALAAAADASLRPIRKTESLDSLEFEAKRGPSPLPVALALAGLEIPESFAFGTLS